MNILFRPWSAPGQMNQLELFMRSNNLTIYKQTLFSSFIHIEYILHYTQQSINVTKLIHVSCDVKTEALYQDLFFTWKYSLSQTFLDPCIFIWMFKVSRFNCWSDKTESNNSSYFIYTSRIVVTMCNDFISTIFYLLKISEHFFENLKWFEVQLQIV